VTDATAAGGGEPLDLRILTPGLSDEEIAAVTSVVAAMIEAQRDDAVRESAGGQDRWRRSLDLGRSASRGPAAWRSSAG